MQTVSSALNATMTWGAAPFVILSLLAWLVPEQYLLHVQIGFLAYSIMIFSFMTGIIWGGRLMTPSSEDDRPKSFLLAIGSFLFVLCVAVLTYLAGSLVGFVMLTAAYLALPSIEKISELRFPANYLELRRKINRTVVVSHVVICVHAIQPHVA
ncbi:hypothetical protein A3742_12260 [Oleiphilus sp. HI0071]|uniref:DUF3429 domain-containing protein n=1 Tax=unclassified Oleiphilus TaxID=2631174 RepID=UPI0007C32E5A|nr:MULTISPECIES: DUF3429 domain-containing protein [unclassified Oleiphilus]KZY67391.1 hypothetical protein A3737_33700 [Oleiphilus sp. HI0065]KZY78303.1 hypothetical protein A3742_23270 [Oleiphilus sp. HI0071]KZY91241.1 hypothetical protein A3744_05135 [Oleiphilus sp. HI0073]KZZ42264.1 hypothetical protein A3758_06780 [Oleiphilus sp. HI0118]KZZ60289.1 hypothetical protein A3760_05290 [Oleiphilus sp. HI0122]KZZ71068.1 hypothetical protein A3765_15300 [Oleiphilus sp. HI0130]KZZ77137.1 hypothe